MGGRRWRSKHQKNQETMVHTPPVGIARTKSGPELMDHKEPEHLGKERFWIAIEVLGEYLALRFGLVWLAYIASVFFLSSAQEYFKHWWGSKRARLAMTLVAPLVIFATYKLTVIRGMAVEDTQEFHAIFRSQSLDLRRELGSSSFWVAYLSSYGQTISPVGLLTFIEFSSSYKRPISISTFTMDFESDRCEWIRLRNIDTRPHLLLYQGHFDFQHLKLIDISKSYNTIWENPVPPYTRQMGMLLFDTPTACDVNWGDVVHLKLTITDSDGRQHPPIISPPFTVAREMVEDSSIGRVELPSITLLGSNVDVTNAYKRIRNDDVRPLKKGEQPGQITQIPDKQFTMALSDGTYVSGESLPVKPK